MSNIVFIMGFNYDSNCYLINDSILVDTGAGHNKDYLFSKLKENGVKPENVELIVNTHCHFDHIGGNYLFPNAKIAVHEYPAVWLVHGLDDERHGAENRGNGCQTCPRVRHHGGAGHRHHGGEGLRQGGAGARKLPASSRRICRLL